MARIHRSTNSFNSVAAGQRATLDLPVGRWTYHQIRIVYGTSTSGGPTRANMIAELPRIAIAVNGKEQVTYSAEQLFAINDFRGRSFHAGHLPIFLGQPWLATPPGQDALAWGTADVDTLQVVVDIDSGASSPTLKAMIVAEPKVQPMSAIAKIRRVTLPVTGTGLNVFTSLPRDNNIAALWLFPDDISDIDEVRVLVDQSEIFKATTAENIAFLEDMLTDWADPSSVDLWPVVFNPGGRVTEPLLVKGASELKLELDMAAANPVTALVELYGLRD